MSKHHHGSRRRHRRYHFSWNIYELFRRDRRLKFKDWPSSMWL